MYLLTKSNIEFKKLRLRIVEPYFCLNGRLKINPKIPLNAKKIDRTESKLAQENSNRNTIRDRKKVAKINENYRKLDNDAPLERPNCEGGSTTRESLIEVASTYFEAATRASSSRPKKQSKVNLASALIEVKKAFKAKNQTYIWL